MNYSISVLFRAVPLFMSFFCFFFGAYIFLWGDDVSRYIAGPVVFFLGSVGLALYTTVATIISQIINHHSSKAIYGLPIVSYLIGICTLAIGVVMFKGESMSQFFIAGHIVAGLGLVVLCVSTVASVATKFHQIPKNSMLPAPAPDKYPSINPNGFTIMQELLFEGAVIFVAIVAWAWTIVLLSDSYIQSHFVAGCVMGGIACVCTSLIALVATIVRQIRNNYTEQEKLIWPRIVIGMGLLSGVWGVAMIMFDFGANVGFAGYLLVGFALVCLSISSAVILLAKVWRDAFVWASRIQIIPTITALTSLFIASFLYEHSLYASQFFVPARVLIGLGAICFSIYSIVGIIDSGTKKS